MGECVELDGDAGIVDWGSVRNSSSDTGTTLLSVCTKERVGCP